MKSFYIPPKVTHYAPDGRGRDSYINFNNGGIFRKTTSPPLSKRVPYTTRYFPPVATNGPKPFHYMPDGTGRDNYVAINSGGLHASSEKNLIRFRNYPRSGVSSPKWNTARATMYNNMQAQKQRLQSMRLSTPKFELRNPVLQTAASVRNLGSGHVKTNSNSQLKLLN